jgi:flagellar biosynthetic protein FliO
LIGMDTIQLISSFAQVILSLIVVCGLIFLTFRVVLPRISGYQFSESIIKIVEKTPIDAKKSLCVIEVGGRWMLIGASDTGVNLISELNENEIAEIEKKIAKRSQTQLKGGKFADKLAEVLKKKG